MILKYKTNHFIDGVDGDGTTCATYYDTWNYLDDIKDCSVFFDKTDNCTCIELGESHNHKVLALHEEAYLINDNGKTIEKIAY